MDRPLGSQISHMLKDRGVTHIFGIPGVHNQEMYRGIEEAGLNHVLARHEQGAGFMADGYARASGKPGVAYVISGPGLTNIMTPMGQAYSDSVPLLVISSCLDETSATRGQLHQMLDQRAAADTVCDWSEEARTAQAAYALIDRALIEFHTQRQRAKHIQVPIALLEGLAPEFSKWGLGQAVPDGKFAVRRVPVPAQAAEPAELPDPVAHKLMNAERPVFVFGGGAKSFGTNRAQVRKLLETCGGAAFMTYAGRGIVPPDYPLSFGSNLARPSSAKVLEASDCVVLVGTDASEVDLWRKEPGQRAGDAIWINTDAEVLARAHPKDMTFHADATEFLWLLADRLQAPFKSGWSAELVAGYRDRWRAEIEAERPGIVPVIHALKDCLPEKTMIYSDMTQFAYAAKEIWDMPQPGHWHHPTGFGTLGYATPAAIGGALARPGLPTIAIIGDYGFQYTVQELATAVELELPLPIFLWDNGKLGEIEASMVRAQIAPNAVIQRNPDFCKLAEAFGAYAAAPQTLAQMQDAVRSAFAADRPTVIRVTPDVTG